MSGVSCVSAQDSASLPSLLQCLTLPLSCCFCFFVSYKNTTAFELLLAEVTLVPRDNWGGDGLLGISVRFTSFEGACENVWHIMVCVCACVCLCMRTFPAQRKRTRAHTHTHMHNPALFTVLGRATWLAGSHGTAAVQHRLRRVR